MPILCTPVVNFDLAVRQNFHISGILGRAEVVAL
jgi:hypothetical protein